MPNHRAIFSFSPESYRIPAQCQVYIDTSVVRRLGMHLCDLPRIAEIYTSVFTLIELLNGITKSEREFRLRRSAIAAIIAAGVHIDWQMPDVRLRCAFSVLREKYDIYESRVACIQSLLGCLAEAHTLDTFVAREAKLKLEHGITYFCEIDQSISHTFTDAARKWIPINRERFGTSEFGDFLEYIGLSRNLTLPQVAEAIGGSDFDCGFGLYALTKRFSIEQEQPCFDYHDRLFRSYDHSIDLYVRASSRQVWREIGHAEMPGRNTGADLTHLQYVAEESFVATTDDGMAAQIVRAGGAVISLQELGAARLQQ